jgi:hypothetical protein
MKIVRTFVDFGTLQPVTLTKDVEEIEVTDLAATLESLQNDAETLKLIIQQGLNAQERERQSADPSGWTTEDGDAVTDADHLLDVTKFNSILSALARSDPKFPGSAPRSASAAEKARIRAKQQKVKETLLDTWRAEENAKTFLRASCQAF